MRLTPHTAAMIFGVPLLITERKLEVILSALGPRMGGVDLSRVRPMTAWDDAPEAEKRSRSPLNVVGNIAVIQVVGTLAHRVSAMEASSGASSYETLAAEFDAALKDPRVEGVLLEVDSFGGTASGCFDLADKIRMVAGSKPVVGVASQFALSAGYALLSQADHVLVPQGGSVGSVGVVTTHVDLTGALSKDGVKVTLLYAGERKVDLSPYKSLTPESRDALAGQVEQTYSMFLEKASRVPGRADAKALRKTQAGIYTGQAAVDAGLANAVGDKTDAMNFLTAKIKERRMSAELTAQVAKLEAQLAEANARNAALAIEASARRTAEDKAMVEALLADTAKLNAPVPPEDVKLIEERLAAGDRAGAAALAAGFRRVAQASGQKAAQTLAQESAKTTVPLTKTAPAGSYEANVAAASAALLQSAMDAGLLPKTAK